MYNKIRISIIIIFFTADSSAQSPEFYPPTVPEQVEITPFNVILYLVVPLLIILAYFLYKKSQNKKREEKKEMRNKKD